MNDARVPRRSRTPGRSSNDRSAIRVGRNAGGCCNKVWPTREGDVVLNDFRFGDGEVLPALRMHYTTLGSRTAMSAAQSTMR